MERLIDKIKNPSSLICYKYANQAAINIPEIKQFKNLVAFI